MSPQQTLVVTGTERVRVISVVPQNTATSLDQNIQMELPNHANGNGTSQKGVTLSGLHQEQNGDVALGGNGGDRGTDTKVNLNFPEPGDRQPFNEDHPAWRESATLYIAGQEPVALDHIGRFAEEVQEDYLLYAAGHPDAQPVHSMRLKLVDNTNLAVGLNEKQQWYCYNLDEVKLTDQQNRVLETIAEYHHKKDELQVKSNSVLKEPIYVYNQYQMVLNAAGIDSALFGRWVEALPKDQFDQWFERPKYPLVFDRHSAVYTLGSTTGRAHTGALALTEEHAKFFKFMGHREISADEKTNQDLVREMSDYYALAEQLNAGLFEQVIPVVHPQNFIYQRLAMGLTPERAELIDQLVKAEIIRFDSTTDRLAQSVRLAQTIKTFPGDASHVDYLIRDLLRTNPQATIAQVSERLFAERDWAAFVAGPEWGIDASVRPAFAAALKQLSEGEWNIAHNILRHIRDKNPNRIVRGTLSRDWYAQAAKGAEEEQEVVTNLVARLNDQIADMEVSVAQQKANIAADRKLRLQWGIPAGEPIINNITRFGVAQIDPDPNFELLLQRYAREKEARSPRQKAIDQRESDRNSLHLMYWSAQVEQLHFLLGGYLWDDQTKDSNFAYGVIRRLDQQGLGLDKIRTVVKQMVAEQIGLDWKNIHPEQSIREFRNEHADTMAQTPQGQLLYRSTIRFEEMELAQRVEAQTPLFKTILASEVSDAYLALRRLRNQLFNQGDQKALLTQCHIAIQEIEGWFGGQLEQRDVKPYSELVGGDLGNTLVELVQKGLLSEDQSNQYLKSVQKLFGTTVLPDLPTDDISPQIFTAPGMRKTFSPFENITPFGKAGATLGKYNFDDKADQLGHEPKTPMSPGEEFLDLIKPLFDERSSDVEIHEPGEPRVFVPPVLPEFKPIEVADFEPVELPSISLIPDDQLIEGLRKNVQTELAQEEARVAAIWSRITPMAHQFMEVKGYDWRQYFDHLKLMVEATGVDYKDADPAVIEKVLKDWVTLEALVPGYDDKKEALLEKLDAQQQGMFKMIERMYLYEQSERDDEGEVRIVWYPVGQRSCQEILRTTVQNIDPYYLPKPQGNHYEPFEWRVGYQFTTEEARAYVREVLGYKRLPGGYIIGSVDMRAIDSGSGDHLILSANTGSLDKSVLGDMQGEYAKVLDKVDYPIIVTDRHGFRYENPAYQQMMAQKEAPKPFIAPGAGKSFDVAKLLSQLDLSELSFDPTTDMPIKNREPFVDQYDWKAADMEQLEAIEAFFNVDYRLFPAWAAYAEVQGDVFVAELTKLVEYLQAKGETWFGLGDGDILEEIDITDLIPAEINHSTPLSQIIQAFPNVDVTYSSSPKEGQRTVLMNWGIGRLTNQDLQNIWAEGKQSRVDVLAKSGEAEANPTTWGNLGERLDAAIQNGLAEQVEAGKAILARIEKTGSLGKLSNDWLELDEINWRLGISGRASFFTPTDSNYDPVAVFQAYLDQQEKPNQ